MKGWNRLHISTTTHPRDHISTFELYLSFFIISGAMYIGEPVKVLQLSDSFFSFHDRPKSVSLVVIVLFEFRFNSMFSGLTSLWIISFSCISHNASSIWYVQEIISWLRYVLLLLVENSFYSFCIYLYACWDLISCNTLVICANIRSHYTNHNILQCMEKKFVYWCQPTIILRFITSFWISNLSSFVKEIKSIFFTTNWSSKLLDAKNISPYLPEASKLLITSFLSIFLDDIYWKDFENIF